MCLIIEKQEPNTLQEDRVVYKVLTEDLRAPLYDRLYTKGVLNEVINMGLTDEKSSPDSRNQDYLKRNYGKGWSTDESLISVGPGFHSCTTQQRAQEIANYYNRPYINTTGYNVYACTVPKGSKYYEDNDELMVSDKIIIGERVNWNFNELQDSERRETTS